MKTKIIPYIQATQIPCKEIIEVLDNSNDDDDILPGVSGQLPPLDVVDLGELEHLPLPPLTDHPEERIDCSLSVLFKSANVVTKFTMN